MGARRGQTRKRIARGMWAVAAAGALYVLWAFLRICFVCMQTHGQPAHEGIPATSWIEYRLIMVCPEEAKLRQLAFGLRRAVSPTCIVWPSTYLPGNSRTKLHCHVNPEGDVPTPLFHWAQDHLGYVVILSRPELIAPEEYGYLDEMLRLMHAGESTLFLRM